MKSSSLLKYFVFVAFAALSVTHCGGNKGSDPNTDHTTTADDQLYSDLYGSWRGVDTPINDHLLGNEIGQMGITLYFTKDSVTARVFCNVYGHEPLQVEVTSPIIITPTRIQVLKNAGDSRKIDMDGNYLTCSISIDQGYVDYQLQNDTLTLQLPTGALVLNRPEVGTIASD